MNKNRRFKRSSFLCGILLLLILLFPLLDLVFAQWEDAQISRLTENEFKDFMGSLTLGKNDKLFLLYCEYTTHVVGGPYKYYLMTKEKDQEWSEPEEIGDTSCHLGQGCDYSVTIDPQTEVMHLLYYEGGKIYYSNSERQNWEKDLIDSGYTYSGKLAIDSLGNVHLSLGKCWVSAGEHYVKYYYVTNVSGEWVQQAISPDIFTGPYSYASEHWIEVEREGVVHIVYAGSYYYKHAWNNALGGTTWTTRYIPPPPGAYDWYMITSFTIDINDRLHMTIYTYLYEPRLNRELYYPWVDDTGWAEPEEITSTGWVEGLFVDQNGNVHIIWSLMDYDFDSRDLYYAHKQGVEWISYQILDHYQYYASRRLHFIIDTEGKGHATFAGYYYPNGLEWDSSEIYYMVGSPTAAPEAEEPERVTDFALLQNYPNPFNNTTIIPFTVTRSQVNGSQFIIDSSIHTTLVIYNILGEKVRTLVDEEKLPGEYGVIWDGKDETGKEVSSGVYFCKLKVGDFSETRKLVLIK
ncbi:MAG: T9SS type A sorting domain-containing protein [Candidatus Zixiibacteriota bacterium]